MKLSLKKLYRKLLSTLYAKLFVRREIFYIGIGDALPAPLSKEEEIALMLRFPKEPEYVRKSLIEHNLRLVVYIARKFDNTGVHLEDLISIGTIGLIKAVNTFDAEKKIKLATYASRCIENEILMHLRRVSKHRSEVSLDEPLSIDWDGNELLLSDILGTEPDIVSRELEDSVDKELLKKAMEKLSSREMQILKLRYGLSGCDECTQKEVADMLGISQSYISRLEKRIISVLRREMSSLQ